MKTRVEQTTNTNVVDEQSDSLINQAPRLKDGADAIKDYILRKVLPNSLLPFGKYGATYAGKRGRADGEAEGEEFSFQDDCRHAFLGVKIRVSKTIAGIVNREKDDVEETIRARLPDMEQEVERKIDRPAVLDLMRAAEALNNALRKQNKFWGARGLSEDSLQIKKGIEYTDWKFLFPLLVVLLGEGLANYWFLEGAMPFLKLIVTIGAVAAIYLFGATISFCLKARHGILIENNQFASFKKAAWSGLVVCSVIIFAGILLFLIFYRAGTSLSTSTGVLQGLSEAFSNNITDLYLALLNIGFLVLAAFTFYKSGWQIHNYSDVANEVERCQKIYDGIRAYLDSQPRKVFYSSIEEVTRRQKRASELEADWLGIVGVCKDIPKINDEASVRIDEKYQSAIKQYREGFEISRMPINPVGGREDIITKIPKDLRRSSPIKPLMESGLDAQSITAQLTDLNMDFAKELEDFNKRESDWVSANESFDNLDEFSRKRIKKIKENIHRELQDDGINPEQDSQSE